MRSGAHLMVWGRVGRLRSRFAPKHPTKVPGVVMVDEAQSGRELPPPTGEPVSLSEPGAEPDVTPQPPAQPHVPRHRRAPSWRRWALDLAVVFLASSALTAWIFRVWDRPLRIPFNYAGDGLTQTSVVKGIIETGCYTYKPRVGAPTGFNS